jgi:5-oxopent-3-ene-1,2,5-tricarboxylate decarboxylase/2-hydroxyhepta-2,4-diene-1,7-dioate isomerase
VYGVALNTESAVALHAASFSEPPYSAPPRAPVLYVKPPNTFAHDGAVVRVPRGVEALEVCTTLGVVFERATSRVTHAAALDYVLGYRVALDICVPHVQLFRPAVVQRCRDGFLPLGAWQLRAAEHVDLDRLELVTRVGEQAPHVWWSAELVRPVARLIAEISQFITFAAGDMLLIGVPGRAPLARAGERVIGGVEGIGRVSCVLAAQEQA